MAQKGDLMTARPDIRVLDATIRDGGLVNNFMFTDDFINALYRANVKAGIDYMEFGYKASKELFDVNKFGKPENQDYTNVDTALNRLLEFINKFGHCDNLAMPLIGTGKAAIREATLENVIEDMIDRFVNSHDKIVQKLIISIRPKDYLDDKVDLKKVKKYMEYKCEFK